MPNILFVLPGNPVSNDDTKGLSTLVGEDVLGRSYTFREVELINNFQTIRAIEAALGEDWHVFIRYQVSRKNPLDLIQHANALKSFIYTKRIDIVHQFWGGPPAFFNALRMSVPFVLSLLGSDLLGAYNDKLQPTFHGKMLRFFSELAARRASAVIVMSAVMKRHLKSVKTPVYVLPEGVDITKFHPIEKALACDYLGWTSEAFRVLFFNYGHAVKNAPLAHQVFEYLKKFVPSAMLIEIKGIAHEELVYYYNACDVLLLTSLHEGSNNSLKEAIACACPIVSSAVGDAKERLTGVIPSAVVDGFQPDNYASILIEFARKPMRSNGPEKVKTISLPALAGQMVEVYSSLLHNQLSAIEA